MGRYGDDSECYQEVYNPYSCKNNSSLMLDVDRSQDGAVRRSLMNMPREYNDYQRSRESTANRGEKNGSVMIDTIDPSSVRYHQPH